MSGAAWAALIDYLAARAIPGVEVVDGAVYRRRIDGGWLELREGRPPTDRIARRIADAEADAEAIDATLRRDAVLRPLVEATPGIRVPGGASGWEIAVRAIVGQQISVAAARTVLGRMAVEGRLPGPEAMLATADARLPMPAARGRALRSLARAVLEDGLDLEGGLPADEVVARMLALPGIGPWTADYVAMRALGDRDRFLATDLGARAGARRLGLPDEPRALAARAERWRPYRSHALMHLWRAVAV